MKAELVATTPEARASGPQVVKNDFREWILTLVLIGTSLALLYFCCAILRPFVSVLSWAIALTVIAHPLHEKFLLRVKRDDVAAALSVLVVAVCILIPLAFTAQQLIHEGKVGAEIVMSQVGDGQWEKSLSSDNRRMLQWLDQNFHVKDSVRELMSRGAGLTTAIFSNSLVSLVELILILFTCFFFFRDRREILRAVKSLVPLSNRETDEVFVLIDDTIHATVYGTVVVSLIQGFLGGLIFWWLDLPAPVLWGIVMAFLAIIPYLGAFIVWGPVALYLALQGQYKEAIILTAWGAIVVGLIDNLLFPILVGKKLRFHTLLVFFFILGGVALFGAAGAVLGPVTLAIAVAMREVWKRRLAAGSADGAKC